VALLSVFIGVGVGCTCESGCHPLRRADAAAWAWWRCTAGGAASDGARGKAGGGLSSSVICAFYICAWAVLYCLS
jgi:hypothetical protein